MAEAAKDPIQPGVEPTPEEMAEFEKERDFYVTWARQNVRTSITYANDILRQLVTLNTALVGAASIFLNKDLMDPYFKKWTVLCFFIAFVIAFAGMLPHESTPKTRVYEIKTDKVAALEHKRRFIWAVAIVMALGFGFGALGLSSFLR